MTITAEELRKLYDNAEEMHYRKHGFPFQAQQAMDAALLAVAKFVAEKQRAVEPTMEMEAAAAVLDQDDNLIAVYRAMQSVAPLVVPE